ncbi:hypothetical protein KH5_09760 [Urechidicola sp. KH5]
MRKITLLLAAVFLVVACGKKSDRPTLVASNGMMNQILLVMNVDMYMGAPGKAMKEVANEPVFGLPQDEPHFNLTQIPLNAFKNTFLSQRNVLITKVQDSAYIEVKRNIYAEPQTIITIASPSEDKLVGDIIKYKQEILQTFKKDDLRALQYKLASKSYPKNSFKTLDNIGIEMQIPRKYRLVDDAGDFLWLRQHLKNGQSMNLIAYELPIRTEADLEGANINSARDSIGAIHIPGSLEDSHYITEVAYTPKTVLTSLAGKKAYETRGKWEVKNDFMAGPLLNYTVVDRANNRLIVVEGFTYAPGADKRDYMFEIEATLKTLKVK